MKMKLLFAVTLLTASCNSQPAGAPAGGPRGLLEGIDEGQTHIVDLTHALNSSNPHWPGPGYEPFKYEIFATLEKDNVLSGRFSMAEHTGTHLDAPNHFSAGQIPVDQIPLDQLFAPAVVIDVRGKVSANADYLLAVEDVTAWEQSYGRIPPNAVVFMYTGWDERWTDFERYKNADSAGGLHFPGFSPEAARLLVDERTVAGLGIDTLSVDYGMSKDFAVHHISHDEGKYQLENVANLGSLPPSGALVIVAPIKIENGTGGPARIFALVPRNPVMGSLSTR
jgi:kynurenine formamidase